MSFVSGLVRRACEYVAEHLLSRLIERDDSGPYLERHYVSGWNPFSNKQQVDSRWFDWLPGIYLHHFLRSDADHELHSHPWKWSLSLILTGGYREQRRVEASIFGLPVYEIENRVVRPWRFNFIKSTTFHRVDLMEEDAWTLFIAGRRQSEWGFWDPETGHYVHWQDHVQRKTRVVPKDYS